MSFRRESKGDPGDNALKSFQMAPSKAKYLLRVKRSWGYSGELLSEITGESSEEREENAEERRRESAARAEASRLQRYKDTNID